ncbi:MAG: hypothetical protein ACJAYU_003355 [Bradymonadia bacterium]|jgi:hypothetical protein
MNNADILRIFESAELSIVTTDDASVTVQVHSGLRAKSATVEFRVVLEMLESAAAEQQGGALSSFARGLYGGLAEPKNSKGSELLFEDAAKTVLPSIEGPLFAAGAVAAGGAEPYLSPFPGELSVAYWVELDLGVRVLTTPQINAWGCTDDRLAKAALSILFHRSWEAPFVATPEQGTIEEFKVGDGLDGARVLMMDQWDFYRVRDAALFALPESDTFLFSAGTDEDAQTALQELAQRRYLSSKRPLSTGVFRFERGKIVGA